MADDNEVLRLMVQEAHLMEPSSVEEVAGRTGQALGVEGVAVYLADYRQFRLVALAPGLGDLDVDTTLAGRAFTTGEVQAVENGGETHLWLPLLDGADRVGVVGCRARRVEEALMARLLTWVSLLTQILVSKARYTDHYTTTSRLEEMTLAADMHWGLLSPLSFTSRRVAVSGVMEPVYEIGGDAFDYALNGDCLQLAIFDAMGHGMPATWPSAVAIGSFRHGRRRGLGPETIYQVADRALREQFDGESFVTAVLGQLDLATGRLRWVNAGHPAPMLVRDARVVARPACEPSLPLGLGGEVVEVAELRLQPEDRLLVFSDGVTEGHRRGAEMFGEDRLADFLGRGALASEGAAETMRRLAHAVLAHHAHQLGDDFTMMLVEYRGGDGEGDPAAR